MNFLTFEDNYLAGQSPERKIIMTNKEKALALIGTFVSGDTAMKTESFNVTIATTSATK